MKKFLFLLTIFITNLVLANNFNKSEIVLGFGISNINTNFSKLEKEFEAQNGSTESSLSGTPFSFSYKLYFAEGGTWKLSSGFNFDNIGSITTKAERENNKDTLEVKRNLMFYYFSLGYHYLINYNLEVNTQLGLGTGSGNIEYTYENSQKNITDKFSVSDFVYLIKTGLDYFITENFKLGLNYTYYPQFKGVDTGFKWDYDNNNNNNKDGSEISLETKQIDAWALFFNVSYLFD